MNILTQEEAADQNVTGFHVEASIVPNAASLLSSGKSGTSSVTSLND